MLSAFIVEDEPLARRRLVELLGTVPWVRLIGSAGDGKTAVDQVRRLGPDLLLVDIEIPELDGIALVRQLRALADPPAVVFTTAYDAHAVTAFELQAVDYLLKPFGRPRLMQALDRVRTTSRPDARGDALRRADTALGGATQPLERLFVRDGPVVRPLRVHDIVRIEGQDDYAALYTMQRIHLVGLRMAELEACLPNPPFVRVHRSHMVNLDHVACIASLDAARLEVHLQGGARVPVSRARARQLRSLVR